MGKGIVVKLTLCAGIYSHLSFSLRAILLQNKKNKYNNRDFCNAYDLRFLPIVCGTYFIFNSSFARLHCCNLKRVQVKNGTRERVCLCLCLSLCVRALCVASRMEFIIVVRFWLYIGLQFCK